MNLIKFNDDKDELIYLTMRNIGLSMIKAVEAVLNWDKR